MSLKHKTKILEKIKRRKYYERKIKPIQGRKIQGGGGEGARSAIKRHKHFDFLSKLETRSGFFLPYPPPGTSDLVVGSGRSRRGTAISRCCLTVDLLTILRVVSNFSFSLGISVLLPHQFFIWTLYMVMVVLFMKWRDRLFRDWVRIFSLSDLSYFILKRIPRVFSNSQTT